MIGIQSRKMRLSSWKVVISGNQPDGRSSLSTFHCLPLSALCFHGLTNCFPSKPLVLMIIQIARGVWGWPVFSMSPNRPRGAATNAVSYSCGLLALFCDADSFAFSNLRTLLPKKGGVGVPNPFNSRRSSSSRSDGLRRNHVVDGGNAAIFR